MNDRYSAYEYLRAGTFFFIYGVVKYLPSPVGDVCRWMVLKLFLAELHTTHIKDGATFWFPHGVKIGRRVSINEWVFIDGYGGVEIGDDCRIAHGCSLISEDHNFADIGTPIRLQGKVGAKIVLGKDCWLGAGVRITKGVTIGDGCVIGTGSVVTRDLPPYAIAVGVPARVIGTRGEADASGN